jgi:hypothetical protein
VAACWTTNGREVAVPALSAANTKRSRAIDAELAAASTWKRMKHRDSGEARRTGTVLEGAQLRRQRERLLGPQVRIEHFEDTAHHFLLLESE